MDAIKTLLDRQPTASVPSLPPDLHEIYGGDLQFFATADRPYVIANFAVTLDGVVSYKIPGKATGGEISGHNAVDRFIMGLLRASADAVLVGSATFAEVSPSHMWAPESICPDAAVLFQRYRSKRSQHPLIVVVSGSGQVDITRAVFRTPSISTLIITTDEGKHRIDESCANTQCSVQVRAMGGKQRISPEQILELLNNEFGARLVLHEGGPDLLGQFVRTNLIDELFLTLAPQIAGRDVVAERPGLVRNVAFEPGDAPWLKLLSVKSSEDHLYLRYSRHAD